MADKYNMVAKSNMAPTNLGRNLHAPPLSEVRPIGYPESKIWQKKVASKSKMAAMANGQFQDDRFQDGQKNLSGMAI